MTSFNTQVIEKITSSIKALDLAASKDDIVASLKKINFYSKLSDDKKEKVSQLITALAGKIKARGGTPAAGFQAIVEYEPNWIVAFFLKIFEFFGYKTERVVMEGLEGIVVPLVDSPSAQNPSQEQILAELKKHLIKPEGHFKVTQEPQNINGSWNPSGKAKKITKKDSHENKDKYKHEWYFKSYQKNPYITLSDKMRIEVLSNKMLGIVLGEENVTKYRIATINNQEKVISKSSGTKTLGEYLGLTKTSETYFNKFQQRITDYKLLKHFIKLNLTCIYLLRDFDLHPFNIMVDLDKNNKIKSFKPIDFGSCLQDGHPANEGMSPFKIFIESLNKPDLVKECMGEVKELIFSKKGEVESHRELVSEALSLSQTERCKVKNIWVNYTAKLEADCQRGQISFS